MHASDTDIAEYGYQLPTTVGETVSLNVERKTVIYFFAPWCSICHASIENLQAIYQKNDHIDVIAVGLDFKHRSEVDDFVAQHQLTFPVAYGNEQIKHTYKISGYPSYYVVNENNIITAKSMGYSSEFGLYLRTL
ncbi:TlpA disulfide reductase family protein [Thalassotalea sp. G2M2-11]|uniref:TlpA disulfide reductase family protein n=1 Tax=Thalassotalea sp. G2M2-11 TaxID=2787627 RepID=UPI0019D18D64|nr:TlpA disulfide reductase family protein [Thalassotalea sp. G2M2-11]